MCLDIAKNIPASLRLQHATTAYCRQSMPGMAMEPQPTWLVSGALPWPGAWFLTCLDGCLMRSLDSKEATAFRARLRSAWGGCRASLDQRRLTFG